MKYNMGRSMKTGIIYFSLEGNTKYVAEKIAKEI